MHSRVSKSRRTLAVSTVTYSYDSVGNRVSMTEGSETTTYSYNGLNQLTSKVDSWNAVKK